eukprot:7044832-Pyramimonas_sp.AAC.1
MSVSSPGVDCRPANVILSAGNIHPIVDGKIEMLCAEWYTSVDRRRLSTVELKSKAFSAVDSGARSVSSPTDPRLFRWAGITDRAKDVIKSGGEWISSIDIENEVASLPQVTH